ncbi:ATP synthase F0 subunit B [Desulfotalea psychrophila]|uniref:ATP synthase subunit b n=1 Tax=Desulfotalea psychrophila (strain LSv54 / DSM 12343) TaxID=177439 RepID=Q6AQ15_DESPS|nr:ATP synthase F0 subunit B [Desulfotalea psychrophila]CAG35558.1 probable ATP synthase, subunit b' (AtpX) [Desulfotalea psychrophila LSv54]
MITMDITLVIQIVNMVVLMFLLNKVLYKPVKKILAERFEKLRGMRGEISKFEKNASLRQSDMNAKMTEASGKAKVALDSARADAQAAGDTKLAAIKAEADSVKEKQLAEVKSQIESARAGLQTELSLFARDMAGKILGRSLKA